MYDWYLVKCKYTKEYRDGTLKRVTEPYLINAASFTDAEARVYEEVADGIRGEFSVKAIKKENLQDIFQYDDSDTWFKCQVSHVIEDADSGKEKKASNYMLVSAENAKQAYDRIEENLKTMMASYEIRKVVLTNILEVYPLDPKRYEEKSSHEEE